MDCGKVGKLILGLRKEKGFTQKQLADLLGISGKTVSKWECGAGCPDVSLLDGLSVALGVDVGKLLSGDLRPNDKDGGNMKRIKFYVCPDCGNVLTATGDAELSCCGRKLMPLVPGKADDAHRLTVEEIEHDFYITFPHEMSKSHYLSFVAFVADDRVLVIKLYPEQGGEVRFPKMNRGKLYFYCSSHGFMVNG